MKTVVIFILMVLLILVTLGVNVLGSMFARVETVLIMLYQFLISILSSISYNTGDILNAASNTVADTAKVSIDVANGAFNDVGNLLKGQALDVALHSSSLPSSNPKPNNPNEQVQWCFVDKGHCIAVDGQDKCASNKRFSSEAKCLASSTNS